MPSHHAEIAPPELILEAAGEPVTFLLTDIEGSTALWDANSGAMRTALNRHDQLFEAVVNAAGGTHVRPRGEGDSRFAVFDEAPAAVAAALASQQAFVAESWPTPRPLRVRMALHTGQADRAASDYYGTAVNRCARLRALALGGQILLSSATANLAGTALPEGARLRDLGERRLRDLSQPERVFQLLHPSLPDEPVPASERGDLRRGEVPRPPTPLIGREREVAAITAMLRQDETRIVTLTGPGGVGKSRLGFQVASTAADVFPDGVFFVPLAPILDPSLVVPAIAYALSIREAAGRGVSASLAEALGDRRVLLLLDNLEQIVEVGSHITDLLTACPRVTVLATSRAVLRVQMEQVFRVPPLGLPAPDSVPTTEQLERSESGRLFIVRARAATSDFAVTPERAPVIAEICRRLDGLPLAIELAAARVRVLTPEAMLSRIDQRLTLLTGGPRDLPSRQQTLRATMAWSYDLLDDAEQTMFRRLAVFTAGCSFEAAESVCASGGALDAHLADILEPLTTLVDQSLLRHHSGPGDESRFWMLETIREYGLEQLEASGEIDAIRQAHADYFLALAEAAEPELTGPRQSRWLDRLEAELDNFQAALVFSINTGSVETGLRLAAALWRFWQVRGHLREARTWLTRMLSVPAPVGQTAGRAKALNAAGFLAFLLGDYPEAEGLHREGLAIRRSLADPVGIAESLHNLGLVARCLNEYALACTLYEEALQVNRGTGNLFWESRILNGYARVLYYQGEYVRARTMLERNLAIAEEIGDIWGRAIALGFLGDVSWELGEHDASRVLVEASLALWQDLGDERGIAQCLESLALLAAGSERQSHGMARSVRLLGAASTVREIVGEPSSPARAAILAQTLAQARDRLGPALYEAAWTEGCAMRSEAAVDYALARAPASSAAGSAKPAPNGAIHPLTRREVEVAVRVARGMTNRQIAAELVIAERTAETHVLNIVRKLGCANRAQVAAWVAARTPLAEDPGE